MVEGECPKCAFQLSDSRHVDEGDARVIQKGTQETVRKGTVKLLQNELERAKVLAEHGVRPQFVKRVMKQELAREVRVGSSMAQK